MSGCICIGLGTSLLVLLPVLLLALSRAVVRLQASAAGRQLDSHRGLLLAARALRGVPGQLLCHRIVSLFPGEVSCGAIYGLLVHVCAQFAQELPEFFEPLYVQE